MVVVIFEVQFKPGTREQYLEIAASLRPELEKIDGFISVERFQSLTAEGKILSLSTWRDEAAVKAWREHVRHRQAQDTGKASIFSDFRIRVAAVSRDYNMAERLSVTAAAGSI